MFMPNSASSWLIFTAIFIVVPLIIILGTIFLFKGLKITLFLPWKEKFNKLPTNKRVYWKRLIITLVIVFIIAAIRRYFYSH